jgi:hypothetical protein
MLTSNDRNDKQYHMFVNTTLATAAASTFALCVAHHIQPVFQKGDKLVHRIS